MFAAGAVGFLFGAGGTLAYFEYSGKGGVKPRASPTPSVAVAAQSSKTNGTVTEAAMKAYYDMGRYGYPSNDTVHVKEGYISSFDPMLRIPRWVMEVITPATVEAKAGSRDHSKFYSNDAIPEQFRSTNGDYATAKGMSRGHLAPAQFHRDSQTAMDSTFDLSLNVVPQDMASNASDWMRVEQLCKKLANDTAKLYVVTGPLFVPRSTPGKRPNDPSRTVVEYDVIGTHQVAVPTHMFKAILAEGKDGSTAVATFVVPNAPVPDELPLTSFLTPKEQVEKWSGLQLFPLLLKKNSVDLCAKHKCEAHAGGLGSTYRKVAKLRAASSPEALEKVWRDVSSSGKPDTLLSREYETQRAAFGTKV